MILRQKQILIKVIQEYTKSARPVSSGLLEKKYNFGIRSAAIRREMQKLTDKGYLYQPHTSAGRVPTDKGYRFFVNYLLEAGFSDFDENIQVLIRKEMENSLKFVQTLTQNLALASSNLAIGYLPQEKILWKEGWKEVLREPEFEQVGLAARFAEMIDYFEKNIDEFVADFSKGIQVFIGKENLIPKAKDFSMIASKFVSPEYEGLFAIFGPKRMSYSKNIRLLNSVAKYER